MIYDRSIVIENINILMRDNGITQADIARKINAHQSGVSECLNGRRDFTLPQIVAIANVFNVSIDSLLGRKVKNDIEINNMADICNLLFIISDALKIDICSEYVGAYQAPKNELVYETSKNLDDYFSTSDELVSIPASKGRLCITCDNKAFLAFLEEWNLASSVRYLSSGSTLYDTWKNGATTKYKRFIKKYGFRTERSYQIQLAEKKIKFCGIWDNNTKINDDEYKQLSEDFNKTLPSSDLNLLKAYEGRFGDLRELALLPECLSDDPNDDIYAFDGLSNCL